MTLPNFLIIGTQKGGTSWMRNMLRQHPDVFMPKEEIHFFDKPDHFALGTAWYMAHFAGAQGQIAVGEKTPNYLLTDPDDPLVMPCRIHSLLPDARLIAILRNPVERAISGINHHIRLGSLPPDVDIDAAIQKFIEEDAAFIRYGYYYRHLSAFYEFYDPARVRVLIYEDDVVARPQQALRATCEFLTIDPAFTFTSLEQKVNARRISSLGIRLVHSLPVGSRTAFKVVATVEQLLGRAEAKKRPSRVTIDQLYRLYADENARLFDLLGYEVASWQPENAYVTA